MDTSARQSSGGHRLIAALLLFGSIATAIVLQAKNREIV